MTKCMILLLALALLHLKGLAVSGQDLDEPCTGLETLIDPSNRNEAAVGGCMVNECRVNCTTPVEQSITITFYPCNQTVTYMQLESNVDATLNSSAVATYSTNDESGSVNFTAVFTGTSVDFGVVFIRNDGTVSDFFQTVSIRLQCNMETTTDTTEIASTTTGEIPETTRSSGMAIWSNQALVLIVALLSPFISFL